MVSHLFKKKWGGWFRTKRDQFSSHYGVFTESRTILIIHFGLLLFESTLDSYRHDSWKIYNVIVRLGIYNIRYILFCLLMHVFRFGRYLFKKESTKSIIYIHTNTLTRIHSHKYTHTNTLTQIHSHEYTHTNTLTREHLPAHIHIQLTGICTGSVIIINWRRFIWYAC